MAEFTAPSCEFDDVNNTCALTSSGDTVLLPPDEAEWGTNILTLTHPNTIKGTGSDRSDSLIHSSLISTGGSDLTPHGGCIRVRPSDPGGGGAGFYRFQNFHLDGNCVGGLGGAIDWELSYGSVVGDVVAGSALVVEHMRFSRFTDNTTCIHLRKSQVRGVIADTEFIDCNDPVRAFGFNLENEEWWNPLLDPPRDPYPYALGMAGGLDNLFFEDNHVFWSGDYPGQNQADGGFFYSPGWLEIGQSQRICYRYNIQDFTHISVTNTDIWDIHGFQSWLVSGGVQTIVGQCGTKCAEFYGNTVINFPSLRWLVFRGGIGRVFCNQSINATIPGECQMYVYQYGIGTESPFTPGAKNGCMVNVLSSANKANYNGEVHDMYGWSNVRNGAELILQRGQATCPNPRNVDWFAYNPDFDGTIGAGPDGNGDYAGGGIGRGTTIIGAPVAAAGLGFAVNPVDPTMSVDPAVVQQTKLYVSNGSSYDLNYEPFTYPHPWRDWDGGEDPPPDPDENVRRRTFFGM